MKPLVQEQFLKKLSYQVNIITLEFPHSLGKKIKER